MKKIFALVVCTMSFINCRSTKKIIQSAVPFEIVTNYQVNQTATFNHEIKCMFITKKEDFNKMFSMTKSSEGSAFIPDFSTVSIIAIKLTPSENVVNLSLVKVESTKTTLQVYYNISDTSTWKSYMQTPLIVASIPKNINLKVIDFFYNENKEATFNVTY